MTVQHLIIRRNEIRERGLRLENALVWGAGNSGWKQCALKDLEAVPESGGQGLSFEGIRSKIG